MKLGSMAPELAKNEISLEGEIDDSLVKQLLTSIIIGLGEIFWSNFVAITKFLARREEAKLGNEVRLARKEQPEKYEINLAEFEPLWKHIISTQGRFSGQLLRLQLQLFPDLVSYQTVLPLFGRNCRDMLSDQGKGVIFSICDKKKLKINQMQVFLHELGTYVIRSKNVTDDFLTPFLLKFLLSGKQAREFALKVAKKLVEDLNGQISEGLKSKIDEKINAGKLLK